MNDKNPDCPCKRDCARHADCAACRKNHAENGKPTACERMKKDKFSALWAYVGSQSGEFVSLSFAEIEKIAGMPIDHSFLTYKKNLERFGWKVAKIAMKCGNVTFEKIK